MRSEAYRYLSRIGGQEYKLRGALLLFAADHAAEDRAL